MGATSGLSIVAVMSAGALRQLPRPPSSSAVATSRPVGLHAAVGGNVGRAGLALAETHGAGDAHGRQGREGVAPAGAYRVRQIEQLHERRVGVLVRRTEDPLQRAARALGHVGDIAFDLELQAVGGGELAGAHGEASLLDADIEVDVAQLAAVGDELAGAQAQMQVGRRGVEPGELRLSPAARSRHRRSPARP